MIQRALAHAIGSLAPRDRLRLACYYAQSMTLAQIGRMLGEHEATASRQLARTRGAIRTAVEKHLKEEAGLTEAEIGECFASVTADAGPLDVRDMLGTASAEAPDVSSDASVRSGRKKSAADRSS